MKHGWFRHKNAICIFGFLFLQLHCKKSSSDNPPPPTPPTSSASACASGLAGLTFEATPVLPAVDPRALKTQNTALQLADTGNGTYTKFQLSCDTDPNAEVIRWKACAVSSGAGCYPKDQEWSVMFECGDLPSLQELQGQVVRFTVQSCIPQHRDQVRIQKHQSVDANELSCESPGQEFIFKLPSNFSDYNSQYASVMDELYSLNQKYLDIGKKIYAVSQQPAEAALNTPATGLALADGTTDASLKNVVKEKTTEALPQWAQSFRNAGPYMMGYLSAHRDAVSSEAEDEVQENQAMINAGQTASLSLASTDSLSSCAGAISSLNDTAVDTSPQITPPPISTPQPVSAPQEAVTDTAWGPSTCHVDQEWNGASNTCVNRCPTGQTWNDGQGTCESPATDTDTTSSSNAAKRGSMIFGGAAIATIGLVILFRTPFSGLRNLVTNKWNYRYQIRGKMRAMAFLQGETGYFGNAEVNPAKSRELWKSPDIRAAAKAAALTEASFKKGLSSEQASSLRKNLHGTGVEPSVKFENLKVEMQKFMASGANVEIKFDSPLNAEPTNLKQVAAQNEKIRFKTFEGATPHGKAKFSPTEGGKWLSRLGGVLVLAGIVIAVLGAVTNLAGDTGGVTGYMQNLVDIDQQTLELGDQAFAQSAQLDAILAAERAAHPGKKH